MKNKPKKERVQIVRRKAGLVIEPPAPRPLENDHPALHFFKDIAITGVPEYRSTAPADRVSVDNLPNINDLANRENLTTGVPEYRSTDANEISIIPSPTTHDAVQKQIDGESNEASHRANIEMPRSEAAISQAITQAEVVGTEINESSSGASFQSPQMSQPISDVTSSPNIASTAAKNDFSSTAIPTSNFYRKTNTIADHVDRQLSPAESKILDQLVRLSIGFNRDWCQVRVSTLLKRTGYRSDKTVREALNGLVAKGIIRRQTHHNNPLGDEYQICTNSGTPVLRYSSTPVKNTAVLESFITGHLKTILKDNKIDDEQNAGARAAPLAATDDPLKPLTDELRKAYLELTGSDPQNEEAIKVQELAQVLIAELKGAAAQTKGVTSPAAFLAAHLRRRLATKGVRGRSEQRTATDASVSSSAAVDGVRLSPEAIAEHVDMFIELLTNGYTLEQATEQFAQGYDVEDWKIVSEAAIAKIAESTHKPNND